MSDRDVLALVLMGAGLVASGVGLLVAFGWAVSVIVVGLVLFVLGIAIGFGVEVNDREGRT